MKINIVGGSGLMGIIHKPILEAAGNNVIISGRSSVPCLEDAVQQSDVTIISVPIDATVETIKRVAPYCEEKALLDFTSVKVVPVSAMLTYTPVNCEVAGLHPLYGNVDSVKGRTMVYCPTNRTGRLCDQVVGSFLWAGLKIKTMTPQEHDRIVNGTLQVARTDLLNGFVNLIKETGLSISEAYELSPPPTKVLLDLVARQIARDNDGLYDSMAENNSEVYEIRERLKKGIGKKNNSRELRDFFGSRLAEFQERAKKYTN